MSRPRIVSTAEWGPRHDAWRARVDTIPATGSLLALTRRVTRAAKTADLMFLDGGWMSRRLVLRPPPGEKARNAEILAMLGLVLRRHPPRVVLLEFTWRFGPAVAGRLKRLLVRSFDRHVGAYCVHSPEERAILLREGFAPERVVAMPFHYTVPLDSMPTPTLDGGVFAGGFSHRDWPTFLTAMRGIDAPATVATPAMLHDIPDHVRVGRLTHEEFVARMAAARVVVVPMPSDMTKSAGLATAINAMALGKPVVVSDVPGVRFHVEDGATGLVVRAGDAGALRESIRWCLEDPGAAVMARRARRVARERFSPEAYVQNLLGIADRVLGLEEPGPARRGTR